MGEGAVAPLGYAAASYHCGSLGAKRLVNGESTRHLSTRVGEHLNVASQHKNIAIKNILLCSVRSTV